MARLKWTFGSLEDRVKFFMKEKDINSTILKENDMAKCPVCKQNVDGSKGGSSSYKGKLYHKSCLRKKRRLKWIKLPRRR